MDEDAERRQLIHEFYRRYKEVRKSRDLREHSHFDIYGNNYIEIWEYAGDKRGRRVVFAKEDTEIVCYKRAIEELSNYDRQEKMTPSKRQQK